MNSPKFDIIFRGDIVLGHQMADVKLKLQQLFKTDAAKVDALFSGRPVPLKRGLDEATAQKYRAALMQAGAMVELKSGDEPAPQLGGEVAAAAQVATPSPAAPKTLAERLAAAAPAQPEPITPPSAASAPVAAESFKSASSSPSWSLAAAGADLLNATERSVTTPVVVDVSAISLRPAEGNLIDTSEQNRAEVARVPVPDFGVAELGASLITAEEKHELPLMEITLEDWEIAAAGSDLLTPDERPNAPIPKVVASDFGLAPAGSDLGQLKAAVKPLNPDISGLRLADSN